MKRVLLFAYFFPPYGSGGVYRSLKFTKYLPTFGWEPIVIAPRPKQYYWAFDYSLLKEIPEHIQVLRTRSLEPFHLFALLDRLGLGKLKNIMNDYIFIPDNKIGWIPFALLTAIKLLKSDDIKVIYTSSPPHSIHLLGCLLKNLTGKPWVADFRDQWTYNPLYVPSCKAADIINGLLERSVYRVCDKIIHVTETDRFRASEKFGVSVNKIITISNGYDEEDFYGKSCCEHKDGFIIAYFGHLYGGREKTLDNFLKGLELAQVKNRHFAQETRVLFCGASDISNEWLKQSAVKNIINVSRFVSHSDAINRMLMSDLLLLIYAPNDKNVISSKLYEYLASEKPILALVPDGETKTILKKSSLGFFCDPSDPENICDTLIELFERRVRGELQAEPNSGFIKQFARRDLTQKLSSVLDELSKDSL